ncbi:FtsW/RodA/SpoVE family cell cycle protein [Paenibacillus sp. YYML68]|uniref:FtsW/RodA/SpoVE family cell cycle protein n=1 Tax=Paenibacillus sp. YYML68 TaxID=2909250 RepID=UPI002492A24A|nr:FtsW/RodA/SpoVE family cell cycle protein [Paenibacillus sp. YYML68]
MLNVHPLVDQYVSEVTRQVKARELRKEIQEELVGHLEERIESKRAEGLSEEAAVRWAIEQMGDTRSVAAGLNQVHKPRIPWAMLAVLAVLLTAALVTMYAVELSYTSASRQYIGSYQLFYRHAVHLGIGLVVMLLVSRINYRKVLSYASVIYGVSVVLVAAAIWVGPRINGVRGYFNVGSITLDVKDLSMVLFLVAAVGHLGHIGFGEARWKTVIIQCVMYSIVPALLYAMVPSIDNLVYYGLAYFLFLYLSRQDWRLLVTHVVLWCLPLVIVTSFIQHGWERITLRLNSFLDRYNAPLDGGYTYVQIDSAIRSAGWWGRGYGVSADLMPNIHSDMILTYMIYSMGWVFSAIVLLFMLVFVAELLRAAMAVRDLVGKQLVGALGSLFAVKFMFSIGMSLGLLPLSIISVPFVSYGGTGMLVQLAAIGLIYSVYRRKDMVRVSV